MKGRGSLVSCTFDQSAHEVWNETTERFSGVECQKSSILSVPKGQFALIKFAETTYQLCLGLLGVPKQTDPQNATMTMLPCSLNIEKLESLLTVFKKKCY